MDNKSVSTRSSAPSEPTPQGMPGATFVGNSNDVMAIIAATTAGVTAFACFTGGYGLYCLPLVPLVLGIITLVNARVSVDPDRSRRWGWISVGAGGVALLILVLLVLACVIAYALAIVLAMNTPPRLR